MGRSRTIEWEDAGGTRTVIADWTSEGRETTRTFRVLRDAKLAAVRLGPDWLACLDADLANNARSLDGGDGRASAALAARWTFFVEDLLRTYAGVAR